MKPFDTGIICWCSLTGHGAGDAFFCTSWIRLTLSIVLPSCDTFLVVPPVGATVLLRIVVPSFYHKYIAPHRLVEMVQFIILIPSPSGLDLTWIFDTSVSMMNLLDLPAFFISMQANLVSNEYAFLTITKHSCF